MVTVFKDPIPYGQEALADLHNWLFLLPSVITDYSAIKPCAIFQGPGSHWIHPKFLAGKTVKYLNHMQYLHLTTFKIM